MQRCEDRIFTDEQGQLDVKTTQLPAMRAYKLICRLAKLFGSSLDSLRGVGFKADVKNLLPVLTELFNNLDEDEAEKLALKILAGTLVVGNGKAVGLTSADAIDGVFSGRLLMMLKVMAFALEVNYRDFFRELLKTADGLKPPATPTPSNP